VWKPPLSAFLSQTWLQYAWTVLAAGTLVAAVEVLLSSWRVTTVTMAGHVGATLAAAAVGSLNVAR
jgi:hypothetical protein